MKVKLTITFKSESLSDREVFVYINHIEDALGLIKAKARELVTCGFHYKEGTNNYFINPNEIFCVSWGDYEAS